MVCCSTWVRSVAVSRSLPGQREGNMRHADIVQQRNDTHPMASAPIDAAGRRRRHHEQCRVQRMERGIAAAVRRGRLGQGMLIESTAEDPHDRLRLGPCHALLGGLVQDEIDGVQFLGEIEHVGDAAAGEDRLGVFPAGIAFFAGPLHRHRAEHDASHGLGVGVGADAARDPHHEAGEKRREAFEGRGFVDLEALHAGFRKPTCRLPVPQFVQGASVVDRRVTEKEEDGLLVDGEQLLQRLPQVPDAARGSGVPGCVQRHRRQRLRQRVEKSDRFAHVAPPIAARMSPSDERAASCSAARTGR